MAIVVDLNSEPEQISVAGSLVVAMHREENLKLRGVNTGIEIASVQVRSLRKCVGQPQSAQDRVQDLKKIECRLFFIAYVLTAATCGSSHMANG